MRVASTDGITVALHDLGGDGPALLLCHATGFCAGVWEPVMAHLPGWHGWAPDLRGHGDADAPTDHDYRWSGFAEDVLAIVDHLVRDGAATRPLVAAGHSKGGAALLLAELARPGTFAALWCYEPVVFPPGGAGTGANPLAEGALRRRATFPSAAAAYANFASKPPLDIFAAEALAAYVRSGFAVADDGSVMLKCPPAVESAVYRMGGQHDAFERLGEVRCPVTIAVGAETPFGPAAMAPSIAERLPAGVLEEHRDLGHFGPMQDPARIAGSIDAALRGAVTRHN